MTCKATPSFDFPDADLILRADGADASEFRVHCCVLAISSPFFRQMFTLPQPLSPQANTDVPVIDLAENTKTVDILLRFIYPIPDPHITTLDELALVLAAAYKYDMAVVIDSLRRQLVELRFVKEYPTRVYAIAARFDLEEEAKIASRYTLGINVLDCPLHDDLKHITAYSYHRLLDLHRRRAEAAMALLQLQDNVKCMKCNGTQFHAFNPPRWWLDFEERAKEELRVRPTTDVVFTMSFIARSAQAGCERCAGSILDAHIFLENLKKSIDDLPSTI